MFLKIKKTIETSQRRCAPGPSLRSPRDIREGLFWNSMYCSTAGRSSCRFFIVFFNITILLYLILLSIPAMVGSEQVVSQTMDHSENVNRCRSRSNQFTVRGVRVSCEVLRHRSQSFGGGIYALSVLPANQTRYFIGSTGVSVEHCMPAGQLYRSR